MGRNTTIVDPLAYLPRKAVQIVPKGKAIYDSLSVSDRLYLVVQGRVKVTATADDGCQTVTGIVREEGLFGESCLIGAGPRSETAVSLEEVVLMAWTREEIEDQIDREPQLGWALAQYLVGRCVELQSRIENAANYKTPERVMLALVQLAKELGEPMEDGSTRVAALTHHTVAEYIGTSREIVTFQLNRLRRMGMVRYTRKHIDVYSQSIEDDLRRQGLALPQTLRRVSQAAD